MITVTSDAFHEKLAIREEEIVLIGPPHKLTGHIMISNHGLETLFIKELSVTAAEGNKTGGDSKQIPLRLITSLLPGEEKEYKIRHRLPANTPVGTYHYSTEAGGRKRNIKCIVQSHIEVSLSPQELFFNNVSPGKSYPVILLLVNKSNLDFTVPDLKHASILDMDYLCRASSTAMRERGGEGIMALIDAFTKQVHHDMVGPIKVAIRENGTVLAPGKSMQIELTITFPDNIDPKKDYFGYIRFWNKVLSLAIKG
jgi:hypothetical protein